VAHLLNVGQRPSTRLPPFERVIDENARRPSWPEDKMPANRKIECWLPVCYLLALVASLVEAADETGELEGVRFGGDQSVESGRGPAMGDNSDNDNETAARPEDGSRSIGIKLKQLTESDIERLGYQWAMPLFGVEQCGEQDGYLCGIGVRLGKYGYFLASAGSVVRITETLGKQRRNGPPGVFRFGLPTELDISKPNNDAEGSRYNPSFKKMYAHNIGVYITQPREYLVKRPYTGRKIFTEFLPRNSARAPLRLDQGKLKKSCMVLSYGDNENGDKGVKAPIRHVSTAHARLIRCNEDHKCQFEAISDSGLTGAGLCGEFSELGAPVLCGEHNDQRIDYIVTNVRTAKKVDCKENFEALDLKFYAQEILDDVNKWESEDEKKEVDVRPSVLAPKE
jgi:hypothetical protein